MPCGACIHGGPSSALTAGPSESDSLISRLQQESESDSLIPSSAKKIHLGHGRRCGPRGLAGPALAARARPGPAWAAARDWGAVAGRSITAGPWTRTSVSVAVHHGCSESLTPPSRGHADSLLSSLSLSLSLSFRFCFFIIISSPTQSPHRPTIHVALG